MPTDTDELPYAGAAHQAELLRSGEITATELTQRHLDRIDRLDGELNAFRVVRADCEAVRRLRAAGAVIVGKTNMPELALWPQLTESQTFGATRNPWDRERSPGGSSGGSAVAVAAGLVAGALGSDGGGSIRVPAASCGVFGIKPQRGRVPLDP